MDERGESRLKLCGALDAATLPRVTRVFESAVAEHCARIIIDLQHVTILDSVGARALRELSTRMKAEGREVVVVGACDQPLLVLKLLRLEALLGEERLGAPRQVLLARALPTVASRRVVATASRSPLTPRGAFSSPPSRR